MSKEYLEAIERVGNNLEHHYPEKIRDFNISKQALQRLEAIENANPSEALEEVKQIEFYVGTILGLKFVKGNDLFSEYKKQDYEAFEIKCEKIKQTLLKAKEQEKENAKYKKAFEIIKEKLDLGLDELGYTKLLTYYVEQEWCNYRTEITEEENNILKEVL